MEILKDKYSITELSERLKVTDHALRYYEKEFGINIPKDERGRRFYLPEMANIMYQIKNMRDEGLEIKAIKKILEDEACIKEPPPVVIESKEVAIMQVKQSQMQIPQDLTQMLDVMKEQIAHCIVNEVAATREVISREMLKSKLELGACVENGFRKLETKMDKHFQEVDKSLGIWRSTHKKRLFPNLFKKI